MDGMLYFLHLLIQILPNKEDNQTSKISPRKAF